MTLPLTSESSAVLRACASALRSGQLAPPVSKMALSRVARCSDALATELLRLSSEGMAAAHMALLLDVAADAVEARGAGAASAELVWTGPEASASHSRDTSVVVEELFANAQHQVIVSSFVVRQGSVIFKPLAARMDQVPNLRVRLFLDVAREWKDTRNESELLREFAADFAAQWPWSKRPELYYDPRTVSGDEAERATWHAKCVLVDDDVAFVTSANFTEWAQQRNVEAGVLLRNRHFAGQLRQQFEGLIQSKQVRRLPGF
ncbi:MAG: DISARM system phospholipase D-like protein DrmC [Acidobacteriota bacterium]|nr:DISARM system phospholipase D-like protein DrmC [Acidobacteriota bacterium]